MIDGGQGDAMADKGAIAQAYAALILKTAAGIYEDIFAQKNVFAKIRIKGREQGKSIMDFPACELGHECPDFLGGTICRIYLTGYALRIPAGLDEHGMGAGATLYNKAMAKLPGKLLNVHNIFVWHILASYG